MHLLVTRPEPDAGTLAARLEAMGYTVTRAPLMEIRYSATPPDLSGVQALAFTSANGVRAFAALAERRSLSVFAVGAATADAARACGFTDVRVAAGDVNALAALIAAALDPARGPVFHAAGSHLAGDLAGTLTAAGIGVRRQALYEAQAAAFLPGPATRALAGGKPALHGVLFHSPRSAKLFEELTVRADFSARLASLTAYCLSSAVAQVLTARLWHSCAVAAAPDQTSLLALLPPPAADAAPAPSTDP